MAGRVSEFDVYSRRVRTYFVYVIKPPCYSVMLICCLMLQIIRTASSAYDRHLILYNHTIKLVRTIIPTINRFLGIPSDEHTTTLSQ